MVRQASRIAQKTQTYSDLQRFGPMFVKGRVVLFLPSFPRLPKLCAVYPSLKKGYQTAERAFGDMVPFGTKLTFDTVVEHRVFHCFFTDLGLLELMIPVDKVFGPYKGRALG
jgi:hypothetical protein